MSRTYLEWVDDEDLLKAIEWVNTRFLDRLYRPAETSSPNRTVTVFSKGLTGRVIARREEAALRSLRTMVPGFHRRILSACDGWQSASGKDFHLVSDDGHQTARLYTNRSLNTTVRANLYEIGQTTVKLNPRAKAFYVVYLEQPGIMNEEFKHVNDSGRDNDKAPNIIREVSGHSFYEFVTGHTDALNQLLDTLPSLLEETIPGHIFLSYSRSNTPTMIQVRDTLRQNNIKVWTDENLKPGSLEWQKHIEQALQECSGIVVLLSENAKESPWVNNEISYAMSHSKRVFPFLIEGDETSSIPISLINSQRIDATQDFSSQLAQLVITVRDHLRDIRGQ